MKKYIKLLILNLVVCTAVLCGCSKKDEVIEQPTETVESSESTDKDKTNKDKKKDKPDKNNTESIITIDELENIEIELLDPLKLDLEDTPKTSGKVIDTTGDFSLYDIEVGDNNDTLQLFDGDYEKYMFNLNTYVIDLVHIKLVRITRYMDDDSYFKQYKCSVEDDLQSVEILLRGLDAKHAVLNSYFTHDTELLSSWNQFYQEMVLVRSELEDTNKTNCTQLNVKPLADSTSKLSSILSDRTYGYGYVTAQDVVETVVDDDTTE